MSEEKNRDLKSKPIDDFQIPKLIGKSTALLGVRAMIRECLPHMFPILITGETGTGKKLVARSIHNLSPRLAGPYVKVNAAAVTGDMAAALFFGHAKGSFTGAMWNQKGFFMQAHHGTLFLDEIGDMELKA